MRFVLLVGLAACDKEGESGLPDGGCEGLRTTDSGADGTIEKETALRVDAQNRTLEETTLEEDFGLVTWSYVYDETGLIDETCWLDGVPALGIRWDRRTDGQPLREEHWVDDAYRLEFMGRVGTIHYEYDNDKLSRESSETFTRVHHRDEDGRVVRIETDYLDGHGADSTVERWYSGPAPELDGGFRTDVGRDGIYEVEMKEWYDGERLIAYQGWMQAYWYDRSWIFRRGSYQWRPDGQLASEIEQMDTRITEIETIYNERGLPTMSLRTISDGSTDTVTTSRLDWSWRCPSAVE